MRDDLLEAKAAVDWAYADFPRFLERIAAWEHDTPYRIVRDVDSQYGKHLFRLRDVKPIPLILSAHAGALIHSIRSSLDILAVTLAERNSHPTPEDVYFPVCKDRATFYAPKGGKKKIHGLASEDVAIIESLEPWKGGNNLLFELHDLDKIRKHRRLLWARATPDVLLMTAGAFASGFEFIHMWPGFKENAVIAQAPADAAQGDFRLSVEIRFAEAGQVSSKPIGSAIDEFARLANSIIELFDT